MAKFTVFMVYHDDSEFNFEVTLEGSERVIRAELMMIVRGTLMASGACKATAYNEEGFDVVSYIQ